MTLSYVYVSYLRIGKHLFANTGDTIPLTTPKQKSHPVKGGSRIPAAIAHIQIPMPPPVELDEVEEVDMDKVFFMSST